MYSGIKQWDFSFSIRRLSEAIKSELHFEIPEIALIVPIKRHNYNDLHISQCCFAIVKCKSHLMNPNRRWWWQFDANKYRVPGIECQVMNTEYECRLRCASRWWWVDILDDIIIIIITIIFIRWRHKLQWIPFRIDIAIALVVCYRNGNRYRSYS